MLDVNRSGKVGGKLRGGVKEGMTAALLLALAIAAPQEGSFRVGTAVAPRGQVGRGAIEVPAGSDAALTIPVAVVNGAKPGPVLAIVSGAHGTEYASIIAVERLIQQLDPKTISGTVILVPLINVPSFEQKIAHVNPTDAKSMNRWYPGKMDGTQTDRASFLITREVVDKCDHLIDLHGGDLDESLRPYSVLDQDREREAGRDVARDGARVRARHDHHLRRSAEGSWRRRAISRTRRRSRGKASITAEAGHAGTVEPDDVKALVDGSLSVMRYLKMMDGAPLNVEAPVWIERVAGDHERRQRHLLSGGEARHLRAERHEGRPRHRLPRESPPRGEGAGERRRALHQGGPLDGQGGHDRQHRRARPLNSPLEGSV